MEGWKKVVKEGHKQKDEWVIKVNVMIKLILLLIILKLRKRSTLFSLIHN